MGLACLLYFGAVCFSIACAPRRTLLYLLGGPLGAIAAVISPYGPGQAAPPSPCRKAQLSWASFRRRRRYVVRPSGPGQAARYLRHLRDVVRPSGKQPAVSDMS
jgi:hypothetical protein